MALFRSLMKHMTRNKKRLVDVGSWARGFKLKDLFHCFFQLMFIWVVVSNIFYFHPLGKIPILTNIFQMG